MEERTVVSYDPWGHYEENPDHVVTATPRPTLATGYSPEELDEHVRRNAVPLDSR